MFITRLFLIVQLYHRAKRDYAYRVNYVTTNTANTKEETLDFCRGIAQHLKITTFSSPTSSQITAHAYVRKLTVVHFRDGPWPITIQN